MPLPKIPAKRAALLSPADYPTADESKLVSIPALEVPAVPVATATRTATAKTPAEKTPAIKTPAARTAALKTPAPKTVAEKTPADKTPVAKTAAAKMPAPKTAVAKTPVTKTPVSESSTAKPALQLEKPKLFVLDTNVLMHDPTSLFRFEEHDVYLPMITLEELDNHKKGMSEVARNARQVSRSLDALMADMDDASIDRGLPLSRLGNKDAGGRLFFQTSLQNGELPPELPVGKGDNQILAVVRALEQQHPEKSIVLVSKDINMRIKARALCLTAEEYYNDHVLEDTDLLYSGLLQLPDDFWEKHGRNMDSWQESKNGFSHTFYRVSGPLVPTMLVNQFVYIEPVSGEIAFYGKVTEIAGQSAVIRTLRDYSHNKHSVWGVTARNREQNFALNLLMDPDCDFVTLLGQAGTGKTLLALASGLAQVLENKLYSEIIVTRVTVPVGEDIGFLPGTEEEKMSPWMGAFDDNLEVLNKSDSDAGDWGRAATQDLIRSKIKIKSLNFMRGRTFVNKYLIIDEAQNLTPKQVKTLVTRAGPGTKIVCLGNIAQIDTPYLTEGSSGLTYVVDRFKGWEHSGHITLARGERSRLADHATEVL